MDKKKRRIGVTVLAWYFIVQGFFTIGGSQGNLGNFAWVLAALFVCIGIGMLKLLKPAYIAAIVFAIGLVVIPLLLVGRLVYIGIPLTPDITGYPVAGVIIGGLLLFFLSRRGVKGQFLNPRAPEP